MDSCETLAKLQFEIEQMVREIRQYQQNPKHNAYVVRKKEESVERLVNIYNSLEPLGSIDLWSQVASAMNELKNHDPQMEAMIIQVGPFGSTCRVGKIKIPFQL